MSHLEKRSEFLNQRKRLLYNNGGIVQLGDIVEYDNNEGRVVNFDRESVNIRFDDGSTKDFAQMENIKLIRKSASDEKVIADIKKIWFS
jgi:hypothetical protein